MSSSSVVGRAGDFLAGCMFRTMNPFIMLPGTGRMPDQLVILDMKHGVEAKNYEEVCPLAACTAGSPFPAVT